MKIEETIRKVEERLALEFHSGVEGFRILDVIIDVGIENISRRDLDVVVGLTYDVVE